MSTEENQKDKPKNNLDTGKWIKSFFDEQIGFKEILLTAILTSLFTTISSFLIVKSEKATEQTYWQKRTEFETLKEYKDRQVETFNEFNSKLLRIEATARDLKLRSAKIKSTFDLMKLGGENNDVEFQSFMDKSSDFSLALNEFSALAQYSAFYFGEGVDTLLNPLLNEVQGNFFFYLSDDKIVSNIDSIAQNFEKDFNSTKGLTNRRKQVIEAMLIDIQESVVELDELND